MTDAGALALVPAHEVVERALAAAQSAGADDGCIVIVEESSEAEVRFANNTVTTDGTRRGRNVTVVATRGRADGVAVGVASRSGGGDVDELVRAAEHDAESAAPAEDAFALVTGSEAGASAGAFADPPVLTGLSGLGGVLGDLAGAFARAESDGRVLAGFAEHDVTTVYLGSSTGLRLRHVQPTGKVQLVARADGGARSAWAGTGAPELGQVRLAELEQRLVERLEWARRTVELDAGRYETVLPPDAVADLMALVAWAASGREAEEGRSVFSAPGGGTKLGQVLSPLPFVLSSDPAAPGRACAPFLVTAASGQDVSVFDNGLSLAATDWIAGGRLERLQYHRAGAARSGAVVTPPIDNLALELPGATGTVADLVAHTDRGLLVTCLWYIREVDPSTLLLTGLTRDGVYLIERGEIVGAVNNFRFNESPVDVLARSLEAGRTEPALSREWNEYVQRTAMPALRVAEFNMSSVSPAT